MRKALTGLGTLTGPYGEVRKWATFTCAHCPNVTRVEAYCDPADIGGLCKICMGVICPRCVGKGCDPFEEKLLRDEARGRAPLDGAGLMPGQLWGPTGVLPTGGGGGGGPGTVANLYTWLSADFGTCTDTACTTTTTTNNTTIQGWKDQSGAVRNYSQSDPNQCPKLVNSVINSKPVLRFDGTTFSGVGQDLEGPSAAALTAGEIFIVIAALNDPPPAGAGIWFYGTDAGNGDLYPYSGDSHIYDGWGCTTRRDTGDPTPSLTSFRLYNVVSTGSEWTSFIDGTLFYTTGTNTVAFTTTPKLVRNGQGTSFSCDIAEVVILSAKASPGDKTTLKTYFASKYGLTIA